MWKLLLAFPLFCCGCSQQKVVIDNSAVLKEHQQPIKVFGIGYWNHGYRVLTLTDANGSYFVIKTHLQDSLKVGDTYTYNDKTF